MDKKPMIRKTDKRTLYTKNVVKDALLELMNNKAFEKITITDRCKCHLYPTGPIMGVCKYEIGKHLFSSHFIALRQSGK